ncbi:PREDICTED: steroid 17-alpha-hydroxylase/17,20 lyase-like isoform X1 [Acropora digitifera]|uniref:steroid 17-alpha-hydroxylase/17,20 lyase-like isoform X1 n=2 Tax=Acropora digitifera TaxID=70779 RepID=UPI00077A811E|nr:PREDICTED: steroid 17-alpha-hydroxylase/17,20 lyase-like isoform X1 [Acropora digitifera]
MRSVSSAPNGYQTYQHYGMALELLALAFVMISAVLLYSVLSHVTDNPKLPPGPMPLPVIGNMLQMGMTPHYGLTSLAKKFGKIFRLSVGIHRMVVVNSIDLAREALVKKSSDFAGRPRLYTADLISRGGKDIAFSDFSPTWKLQRKVAHSALKMFGQGIKPIEEKVSQEIDELITRFQAVEGLAHDPQDDVVLAVINIICAFVFGSRYDLENPEFRTILNYNEQFVQGFRAGNLVDYFPWLRHFPSKGLDLIRQAVKDRDIILQRKFDEHKSSYQDCVTRDLTDALIKAMKESQSEEQDKVLSLTEDHVVLTMNDIFSAGLETTSTCVLWALAYLVRNPKVQQRIHQELDDVIGRERLPELADKANLPYLDATIMEVLRYSSLVPLLFPHSTTADTTLDGYEIPKDTIVLFNVWAMHHDEKKWDRPFEFDPSRFLDAEGKVICPGTLSYLPFGAGRRVCLAESLGKIQLFLFISRLLHKFQFSVPSNGEAPDLEGIFGASLCPKPYSLNIERRY